ncbi:hypothetical protein [Sphingomonas sp. QA11]|nr:hypothetical protein [Sphingomonas sp. QA11]
MPHPSPVSDKDGADAGSVLGLFYAMPFALLLWAVILWLFVFR